MATSRYSQRTHDVTNAALPPPWQRSRQQIVRHIQADLHSEGSILLPVRVFIGLGWLRAGVEKLLDPGWLDGMSLTTFLTDQVNSGQVVFPVYERLITSMFLAHAPLLSWIVLIGQLLVGLSIMLGCCTRVALIGGLFMNLNFVLAGVPNPSAFYLVIQIALLLANTGGILSVDAWLGQSRRLAWLTARPARPQNPASRRVWTSLLIMALCAGSAGIAAAFISDFSPAGSVHDPAMILTILASMATGWAGLSYLQRVLPPSPDEPSRSA